MKTIAKCLFLLLVPGLVACTDRYDWAGMVLSQSPDVNRRFAESVAWNAAVPPQHQQVAQDCYRLYVGSDLHIGDGTEAASRFVSDCLQDPHSAPFALVLGDFVNRRNRFALVSECLAPLAENGRTLFPTVGNHDLYFGQWSEYRTYFHTATYWFEVTTPTAGKDLFICLDSGSGTLGTRQRAWVEEQLRTAQGAYRHIFILTHTHFFLPGGTPEHARIFNTEEEYDLLHLFARYGVDAVFSGHDHHRADVTFKGVRYFVLDALSEQETASWYGIFTIGDDITPQYVRVR